MSLVSHTPQHPFVFAFVGTTASGKTKLATACVSAIQRLYPESFTGFDFISADSRQVYQGLEITTGADIPATSQHKNDPNYTYGFFEQQLTPTHTLRWHGQSIISTQSTWSVADFKVMTHEIIQQSLAERRLVCIIGGTGLYQLAISDPTMQDVFIKPDTAIRTKAATLTLTELQQWLQSIDTATFQNLNQSDQQNPRRLIRHIEKLIHKPTTDDLRHEKSAHSYRVHTFGIQTDDLEKLTSAIANRVRQRIELGALQEVALLDLPKLDPQARTTLGVREIKGFLESQYDLAALEQIWTLHEKQYAKRQLTWWKKQPNIHWLDEISIQKIDVLINQIVEMTGAV